MEEVIIETERLILRPRKLEDVDDMVEGLNNLNVSKWLSEFPYPYTKEDAIKAINKKRNNAYIFSIVLKENKKVIGGVGIIITDPIEKIGKGGIWINEKYQKKGYGKEAFKARIKFAFEELNLSKIEDGFFVDNEKSRDMQLSIGYRETGIIEKNICKATGEEKEIKITEITKEDYKD